MPSEVIQEHQITESPDSCEKPSNEKQTRSQSSQSHTQRAFVMEEKEEEMEQMNSPFSSRTPKHIVSGTISGAKNLVKGVVLGIGAFIGSPIAGVVEGGLPGLARGLVAGVFAGILLPISGAVFAVLQVSRGVYNTPKAVKEEIKGEKIWDKRTRQWTRYDLKKEHELLSKETEEQFIKRREEEAKRANFRAPVEKIPDGNKATNASNETASSATTDKPKNNNNVKDMEYYNLLKVDSDATPGQIKKAYYLRARELHPDKNRNDPNANEKFQAVGAAYQVLWDPQLRAKYDSLGKDGVGDAPVMDSSYLYMMLFGSEKFEFYVGELKLAMLMMQGEENEEEMMNPFYNPTLEYKQAKREVICAMNLAKFLDDFIAEAKQTKNAASTQPSKIEQNLEDSFCPLFKARIQKEIEELTSTALGGAMVGLIGQSFAEEAKNYLGFQHSAASGFGLVELRRRGHVMRTQYKLVASAFHGYNTMRKKGYLEEGESKQEEKAMEGFFLMIDTLWRVTVIDVEGTIRKICYKLFKDVGVSSEDRILRAKGILILGRMFRKGGKDKNEGLKEIKEKLKRDFEASKAAAGAEVNSENKWGTAEEAGFANGTETQS